MRALNGLDSFMPGENRKAMYLPLPTYVVRCISSGHEKTRKNLYFKKEHR